MADQTQLLLEAERRGILPPDRQALLDEARRRKLIPRQQRARERLAGGRPAIVDVPGIGKIEFPASMSEEAISSAIKKLLAERNGPTVRQGVVAPDGQSATVRLTGPAQQPQAPQAPGMASAATRGFSRQLLDNLLAAPFAPFNLAQQGISAVTGSEPVQFIPPSAAQVQGDVGALVRTPQAMLQGDPRSFSERSRAIQHAQSEAGLRAAEQQPGATLAGEIGGDIATIAATRGMGRGATGGLAEAAQPVAQAASTILGRALQSFGRATAKTGTRAAQTGADAAFLAAIQDSDPTRAGAIAAGIEAGTAPFKGGTKFLTTNRLGQALLMGTFISLGVAQWTPGGLDRLLPSIESVNKHAFAAAILGVGSGALTGRAPPGFAGPAFAATVNGLRLGTMKSVLSDIVKDPSRTAPIVAKFSEDPDFFGAHGKRLLTRALTDERASLSKTIDTLMDDPAFRRQFRALSEGQRQ